MKAARLYGPNDIRIMDVETPKPGPHDLLCRVVRAGICGTDYSIYSGEFSGVKDGSVKFPLTPGHEWSGLVERAGTGVAGFHGGPGLRASVASSSWRAAGLWKREHTSSLCAVTGSMRA